MPSPDEMNEMNEISPEMMEAVRRVHELEDSLPDDVERAKAQLALNEAIDLRFNGRLIPDSPWDTIKAMRAKDD